MRLNTLLATVVLFAAGPTSRAQEAKKPEPPAPAGDKTAADPTDAIEELEAKFKKAMTDATLTGRWCLVAEGKIGDAKDEKYTVTGVTKLFGENWLIHARIQYGDRDVTAPFPVKVKWAGDTPVITVNNLGIPGGASYSARVMIYEGTYAGTWSGGKHAGLMNGVISNGKQ